MPVANIQTGKPLLTKNRNVFTKQAANAARSSSLAAQVADLAVNEVATKCFEIHSSFSLEEINQSIAAWRHQHRNNCGRSVAVAKERVGGEYSIETEDLMTGKGRMFVVVLITRLS